MEPPAPGRPIIRFCAIAFLGGVLLVQQLPSLPPPAIAWLFAPLLLIAWRRPRLALPPLFLLAGLAWAGVRADLILTETLPAALEGEDLRVEGRVADIPSPTERGLRFIFEIEQAWHGQQPVTLPARVQLSLHTTGDPPGVGDRWAYRVRLKRPHGFQNPGGFDQEAHLFQQRIRATGYVREDVAPRLLATLAQSPEALPGYRLNRFRQELGTRIRALLPGQRFAPMIAAFANGDDHAIPDDQWEVLTRTGTGHLIAISGMNIGLIAGLVFFLLRWLWSRLPRAALYLPAPRFAAAGALLAAAGYAALAGFAIPTQRALVMLAVALGGMLLGRRSPASVLLALALLVVLVFDPLAVLAPGFWLSFGAVAAILYVITHGRAEGWRARLYAWGRIQWAVTIGLLPVLLLLFQQASVSGMLANLLAIPVVESVVIPATLAGAAASQLLPDALAVLPLAIATQALEWLWLPLAALAGWPGSLWTQQAPPLWTLATAAIGVALLLAPRGFPARWLGAIWLLPMFLVRPPGPAPGEAWLTLLDVGQGLSAVVRTAEHTLVYDTGAKYSARFDAGRAVLVPFLRHAGIAQVDTLVISHGDNDHIGGSASLRAALPVARVLSSVPERLPGAQACAAGQHWEWDGVRFEILHPDRDLDSRLRGNNRCCVVRVVSAHGRVLLPGDIAARAERHLLAEHDQLLRAEVLVVPHHGSRSSSTENFIEAVQPRIALLPFGYRNRYRHPHPDVVARYRAHGVALEDSPAAGAIGVRLSASGLKLDRYREEHRRYWYGK
jgi:competence protein ComEC